MLDARGKIKPMPGRNGLYSARLRLASKGLSGYVVMTSAAVFYAWSPLIFS